jgi:hypothetical protein
VIEAFTKQAVYCRVHDAAVSGAGRPSFAARLERIASNDVRVIIEGRIAQD